MAYSFGKEFGWWLTEENTGRRYVVRTLTRDGAFAVNLPAGRYRVTGLIYDKGVGAFSPGCLVSVRTAGVSSFKGSCPRRFFEWVLRAFHDFVVILLRDDPLPQEANDTIVASLYVNSVSFISL